MRKTHKTIATILTAIMSVTILPCTASASEAVSQETVKEVQQALNEAGFDCGTPDGIAGKGTAAAVSAYQEANGLPVDGQISEDLLASLGIGTTITEDDADDVSAADNAVSSGGEFSEDAYDGEWVSISDVYEIYLPSGMTLADDKELEELTSKSVDSTNTYLFSAKAEAGMTINFYCILNDAFDFTQSEQTGIKSIQDFWNYFKEQITSFSQPGSINSIEGLYFDNISPEDGSPNPSYLWFSEDAINCLEFRDCGDESGIEFAKTIMESLRRTEVVDVAEETESVELTSELTSEAEKSAEDTSEAAQDGETEEEVYLIDANGQYSGVTDEGHFFKWYSCTKIIFYMDEGFVYEIGPYDGQLVFGRLKEDMTFDESTISILSADPNVLENYAELAYGVWSELLMYEDFFEANFEETNTEDSASDSIEFETARGISLTWNDFYKFRYVYNAENVYQISLVNGDLVFGKLNEDGESYKWYTSLKKLEKFPEIMDSACDLMIIEAARRYAEDSK